MASHGPPLQAELVSQFLQAVERQAHRVSASRIEPLQLVDRSLKPSINESASSIREQIDARFIGFRIGAEIAAPTKWRENPLIYRAF